MNRTKTHINRQHTCGDDIMQCKRITYLGGEKRGP